VYPPSSDFKTPSTIVTSIVHAKLGYYNSLYYNLRSSQITHLQQTQSCLARAAVSAVKAPKSCYNTHVIRCLQWLKITERIEYKLLSLKLIYTVLTTTQPSHLHNLITVERHRSTRSSALVSLARPPISSSCSLRITDLHCDMLHFVSGVRKVFHSVNLTSSSVDSPLSSSTTLTLFHTPSTVTRTVSS